MKVSELIERLLELPQDAIAITIDDHSGEQEIVEADVLPARHGAPERVYVMGAI